MNRLKRYAIYAAVLLLLGIAGLCGYCARDKAACQEAAAARRTADETALRAAGALTAERATRDELERESAVLRDQLARVRASVPDAEVREVERWRTETVPASCPVEEPVVAGCGAPTRPCLLRPGDQIDVRAVEATVETSSGARGLVGSAEVWSGTRRIAAAPFSGGRYLSVEPDLPRAKTPPRWAATAGYGWSSRGTVWLAGVERRVAGPAWIGAEGGVVGGDALIVARVRVEW